MNEKELLIRFAKCVLDEYPKYYRSKFDLSIAANVDEKTIRRILNAEQNFSIKIFLAVCFAIKVKPSDFFKEVEL